MGQTLDVSNGHGDDWQSLAGWGTTLPRPERPCWPPHLTSFWEGPFRPQSQETLHSAPERSQQGLRYNRGLIWGCACTPSQALAMPLLLGICHWECFRSAIFPHHLGFIFFGLDFFQLISLVDLTHSPCTMSMKSRPACCPSRHICKYGLLSLR